MSTRPPGRSTRAASRSTRAGSAAWCSACDSSTTSRLRSAQRQLLEVAALPGHVADPAPLGQLAGPRQHRRRAIHADHLAGPARRLEGQVAFAAADVGDVERRQQVAERSRPGRPAAARAPAGGRRGCRGRRGRRSSHDGGGAPPGCGRRRHGPRRCRRPARIPCRAASTTGRRRRRAGPGGSRSRCRRAPRLTRPASLSSPRWRDTPDWASPRMPVSSDTLKRSRLSVRSSRSRAGSPSIRKRAEIASISINLSVMI